MTQKPFDQFSKQLLKEFLTPLGQTITNYEVPGEPRYVDVWFKPSKEYSDEESSDEDEESSDEDPSLGILGTMATHPCLIEPFRYQPKQIEVRACLLKLTMVHAEIIRKATQEKRTVTEKQLPVLWILTPTARDGILEGTGVVGNTPWIPGIYFTPGYYKTAIVVIDQLPAGSETFRLSDFRKRCNAATSNTRSNRFTRRRPTTCGDFEVACKVEN